MSDAEVMEKLRALPLDKQLEVFDFIEFLATRYRTQAATASACEGESPHEGSVGMWSAPLAELRAHASGGHGDVQPGILPRKPLDEDEIQKIMQETCGAWGTKTLAETESMIRQRRIADWGEDERAP